MICHNKSTCQIGLSMWGTKVYGYYGAASALRNPKAHVYTPLDASVEFYATFMIRSHAPRSPSRFSSLFYLFKASLPFAVKCIAFRTSSLAGNPVYARHFPGLAFALGVNYERRQFKEMLYFFSHLVFPGDYFMQDWLTRASVASLSRGALRKVASCLAAEEKGKSFINLRQLVSHRLAHFAYLWFARMRNCDKVRNSLTFLSNCMPEGLPAK